MQDAHQRFDIPFNPTCVYRSGGDAEYRGQTVFRLTPEPSSSNAELDTLVTTVLAAERYTYGDWFDLPAPVYLVHDRTTGDVFRVVVRDGRVEFHVLANTEPEGLSAMYDLLVAESDVEWRVTCRTTERT